MLKLYCMIFLQYRSDRAVIFEVDYQSNLDRAATNLFPDKEFEGKPLNELSSSG